MLFSRGLLLASAALLAAMAAGPALAQMPCMNEVMPLRQAVEKDAAALKAAIDRKADRSEICNGFKRFAAAEAKFLKYLEANQQWCGVPPDAIKQVKTGHDNTLKMRGQACAAGPIGGQPGPPPGPGLSEALGTSRAHMPAAGPADRGTYNTLTGNPFDR